MFEIRNLTTHYGNIRALEGISINVTEGEIVTIIGANGAGKTTTLNTISGLIKPTMGEIIFKDENIGGLKPHSILAKGISQVPEGRKVFPDMTVEENLKIGAYLNKNHSAIRASIEEIYGYFPILRERHEQLAGTLSGGEQQMLAMGRCLMSAPKLMLLDEPSLGLSPLLVAKVLNIVCDINRRGISILLVEQKAHAALKISSRGYVIETGRIVLEDKSQNLLTNELVKKAYLGI
jgi:branched-chain amino acid transport system ATP-binding protein